MHNNLSRVLATFGLTLLFLSVGPVSGQYCGDGICNFGENCPFDCGGGAYCGDYICSPELGEDRYSCTQDCVCGDGVCSYGEDSYYCSTDCGPPPTCTTDTCSSCSQPVFGDYDYDSVPDRLEYDLAHKFFPNILLQTFGNDLNQMYLYNGKAIPYTVTPKSVSGICNESYKCLEIRYGTAYYNDIGSLGHSGDSEFYAALVMRTTPWSSAQGDANQWQLVRDFTAAHWSSFWAESSRFGAYGYCSPNCHAWDNDQQGCFDHSLEGRGCGWVPGQCYGGSSASYYPCSMYSDEGSCYFAGGSCRWMKSQCFPHAAVCDQTAPLSAPPTLWASTGKHGLYHSTWECDNGGFNGYDSCSTQYPPYNMRSYKGQLLQNIGQSSQHSAFDTTIQYVDNCYLYDVWGGVRFGGSTDYRKHFTTGLGWPVQ